MAASIMKTAPTATDRFQISTVSCILPQIRTRPPQFKDTRLTCSSVDEDRDWQQIVARSSSCCLRYSAPATALSRKYCLVLRLDLGTNKTAAIAPAAKPATRYLTSFLIVIASPSPFFRCACIYMRKLSTALASSCYTSKTEYSLVLWAKSCTRLVRFSSFSVPPRSP
jgi:hypothetical protein